MVEERKIGREGENHLRLYAYMLRVEAALPKWLCTSQSDYWSNGLLVQPRKWSPSFKTSIRWPKKSKLLAKDTHLVNLGASAALMCQVQQSGEGDSCWLPHLLRLPRLHSHLRPQRLLHLSILSGERQPRHPQLLLHPNLSTPAPSTHHTPHKGHWSNNTEVLME